MEETLTKEQVIAITIDLLSRISVPVMMKKQITDPIEGAVQNLNIVLEMIEQEKTIRAEKDKPELREVVPDDDSDQSESSVQETVEE